MSGTVDEIAAAKQRAREVWASGDYHVLARHIWEVGGRVVAHVGVGPGDDVLDVACGTGNATIPAAQTGARVVGLDLTPELFETGRAVAAEAGVEIEWVQGDAEQLPFGDESFDVVLSTFGCMFAPRHQVVADELVRVLRPGGRLGICSWAPDGAIGDFFATIGSHLPPGPPFASPPPRWGDPTHVRSLFEATDLELRFEREVVELRFDSVAEMLDAYETKFGPVVTARETLEPAGRWQALRDDLEALFERFAGADGKVAWPGDYLAVLGERPGA